MSRLVLDVESDGLLPELTTLHSLVLRDVATNDIVASCSHHEGPSIEHGLTLAANADVVYAHNGIDFDTRAIQKVYPRWQMRGKLRDTLVIARMRFAHIKDTDYQRFRQKKLPGKLIGSHSLKAWGYRLGMLKGTFGEDADWATWSPEMQRYCELDTDVTRALVLHLRKSRLAPESIETEHELAHYLVKQEENGVVFDLASALDLRGTLAEKRQELEVQLQGMFKPWYRKGKEFTPKVNNTKLGYVKGRTQTKIILTHFKPSSRQHIADRLVRVYGWKPDAWTPGGQPQLDDDTIEALDLPAAQPLVDYLLVSKRLGQIADGKQAWLKHIVEQPEGHYLIHGRVNQGGTVTHRASHSNPNLGQVPRTGSPYGEECRALFGVPEGWLMLGADASGLELRCLAHYMARWDGGAYGRTVVEGNNEDGTDVHSVNRDALGLEGSEGRNLTKTFVYALLYGSGDENLGRVLNPALSGAKAKALGKKYRARLMKGLPALDRLTAAVKQKAKRGYLQAIDGRRVYVRSDHAALNSLLQSAGAIICKRWIVEANRRLTAEFGPQGWDGQWAAMLWVHDEIQLAVRPDIAERAARIVVESIEHMTEHFKFRVPLTGEAKLGRTWAETH